MKPYEKLTLQGRLRCLRQLTLEALKAYDLRVKRVNFFARIDLSPPGFIQERCTKLIRYLNDFG